MLLGARAFAAGNDEKGIELIARAAKAYEAGAYTTALKAIEEAFKLGLSNELAARAILLRAECLERNGNLANALSDYSSALWMQNLPAAERKKATEGKERVIAAMGLNSPSERSRGSAAPASASNAQSSQSESSGGILGVFNGLGGLFGSSSNSQSASASEPPKPVQTGVAPAAAGWKTEAAEPAKRPTHAVTAAHIREVSAAKPAPQPHASARAVTAAATSTASGEGFHIDFGSANSESSARSRAQQIKAQLSDILVHRELVVSNGSSGFHILAGPYKVKSAAMSLCSAIKQRGVTCQVTP
jgi:cell division septation protein DedD